MTLTHEDLRILQQTFAVHEHKFVQGSGGKQFAYIDEDPLMARIESVDPAAGWKIDGVTHRKDGDTHNASVWGTLTIKGVARSGMGSSTVSLYSYTKRKTNETITDEANQAEKSATTDALKRAGRMFGIGRYLLTLPDSVQDHKSLERWLNKNAPQEPLIWNPTDEQWNNAMNWIADKWGMDSEDALFAMESMQQTPLPFLRPSDWKGTKDNAVSAWLAYAAGYDVEIVGEAGSNAGLGGAVIDKAKEYAPRMQAYHSEKYPGEVDQPELIPSNGKKSKSNNYAKESA